MAHKSSPSLFQPDLVRDALAQSFRKLDPRIMLRNPVMFCVEIGTFIMLAVTIYTLASTTTSQGSFSYNLVVFLILLVTLLFANFAEALAEARGKAQAESLRKTRAETPAKRWRGEGLPLESISSAALRQGDSFYWEAGDTIPTDGEIVEGLATIDESAITGESAPVIREAGKPAAISPA